MKKSITVRPPGAHSAQVAVFVAKIAAGISARDAAQIAGYANPSESARRLLARRDVQALIMEESRGHDIELASKSRHALHAMLDSSLTPAAVKARIALSTLDRLTRAEKDSNTVLSVQAMTPDELAAKVHALESLLRNSGDTINQPPNAHIEHKN